MNRLAKGSLSLYRTAELWINIAGVGTWESSTTPGPSSSSSSHFYTSKKDPDGEILFKGMPWEARSTYCRRVSHRLRALIVSPSTLWFPQTLGQRWIPKERFFFLLFSFTLRDGCDEYMTVPRIPTQILQDHNSTPYMDGRIIKGPATWNIHFVHYRPAVGLFCLVPCDIGKHSRAERCSRTKGGGHIDQSWRKQEWSRSFLIFDWGITDVVCGVGYPAAHKVWIHFLILLLRIRGLWSTSSSVFSSGRGQFNQAESAVWMGMTHFWPRPGSPSLLFLMASHLKSSARNRRQTHHPPKEWEKGSLTPHWYVNHPLLFPPLPCRCPLFSPSHPLDPFIRSRKAGCCFPLPYNAEDLVS